MGLEGLEYLGCLLQIARRHHNLSVPRQPSAQGIDHDLGDGVVGVFHQHRTRAGEKAGGLDRVQKKRRVPAQVGPHDARKAHFFFRVLSKKCRKIFLPFQSHPHCIATVDQDAGLVWVRSPEQRIRVARRQLHEDRSAA